MQSESIFADPIGDFLRADVHTRLVLKSTGLLPPSIVTQPFPRILDVGCGSGTWLFEMSFVSRYMQLTGVDTNEHLIKGATTKNLGRMNVLFDQWDPLDSTLEPPFPPNYFSLIRIAFASRWVPNRQAWERLLTTCRTYLRTGGVLLVVEHDGLTSTSTALSRLDQLTRVAYAQTGRFPSGNSQQGTTLALVPMLTSAGYERPEISAAVVDFSYEREEQNRSWRDYFRFLLHELTPYLTQTGVTTVEELEALSLSLDEEMFDEGFIGLWTVYSFLSYKP